MFGSTRFSLALHVMVALAKNRGQRLQSEALALSIGTNSSFLRQIVSKLRTGQLIDTKQGKGGGITLVRSPSSISILEIFQSVEEECAIQTHNCNGVRQCIVADKIPAILQDLSAKVKSSVENELRDQTLQTVLDTYF